MSDVVAAMGLNPGDINSCLVVSVAGSAERKEGDLTTAASYG